MSTVGMDFPGGDPSSAAFPAQLDALRDAIAPRTVPRWATLDARASYYAEKGLAVDPGLFVIDSSPTLTYRATGTTTEEWVVYDPSKPWAAGQTKVTWSTASRYSDLTVVTFPVGLFSTRPTVIVGTQDTYGAVAPVSMRIGKTDEQPAGAEITTEQFQVFGVALDDGVTLGPSQWRYCHWVAEVRTQGEGV